MFLLLNLANTPHKDRAKPTKQGRFGSVAFMSEVPCVVTFLVPFPLT
jgi:hypothetical protein